MLHAVVWLRQSEWKHITQNGKVVRETIEKDGIERVLDYIYDESGRPSSLIYTNGSTAPVTYYYVLNLQGDVEKIIDANGVVQAQYTYDPWGKILSITDGDGDSVGTTHIGKLNSLRYRGYCSDTETHWYYLQSRYYDPITHRFINADSYTSTSTGFLGYNMFAYCNNCPIKYIDSEGTKIKIIDSDPNDQDELFYMLSALTSDTLVVVNGEIKILEYNDPGRLRVGTNLIRELISYSEDIRLTIDEHPMKSRYFSDPDSNLRGDFGNGGYIAINREEPAPGYIKLAHELIHAWRDSKGFKPDTTFMHFYNCKKEELIAIGIGDDSSKYTENMIRAEHGLPYRTTYQYVY